VTGDARGGVDVAERLAVGPAHLERGAIGVAFRYVLVSVIGSIAALFAGLSAVRAVA